MSASAPEASGEVLGRGRGANVALVLWPSFLAACVASLLFFAAVDPQLLSDAGPRLFADLSREEGYALGFLFFWATAAIASTLSVFLIRSARGSTQPDHRPPRRP
jgi:hypothetical protein